jgi:hypothetical protein
LENLWVVDHRINLAKGTLTLEEFITMCREVVRHHDTAGAARLANASTDMASRQGGMVPPEKTLFSSGHAE